MEKSMIGEDWRKGVIVDEIIGATGRSGGLSKCTRYRVKESMAALIWPTKGEAFYEQKRRCFS